MVRLGVFTAASLFAALSLASLARAAEIRPYSAATLKAAQDAGKPVVVDITATWCSTCKAQKPIVSALAAEPRFADLLILDMDFDTEKPALRALHVREQSTFIAYKGATEVGRSTGDTDKASIAALFAKTN